MCVVTALGGMVDAVMARLHRARALLGAAGAGRLIEGCGSWCLFSVLAFSCWGACLPARGRLPCTQTQHSLASALCSAPPVSAHSSKSTPAAPYGRTELVNRHPRRGGRDQGRPGGRGGGQGGAQALPGRGCAPAGAGWRPPPCCGPPWHPSRPAQRPPAPWPNAGQQVLQAGGSAVEAVEAAVVALEDEPCFNAGRGAVGGAGAPAACCRRVRAPVRLADPSPVGPLLIRARGASRARPQVYTASGRHELEASIMTSDRRCALPQAWAQQGAARHGQPACAPRPCTPLTCAPPSPAPPAGAARRRC
jgi:hypothetical protein